MVALLISRITSEWLVDINKNQHKMTSAYSIALDIQYRDRHFRETPRR